MHIFDFKFCWFDKCETVKEISYINSEMSSCNFANIIKLPVDNEWTNRPIVWHYNFVRKHRIHGLNWMVALSGSITIQEMVNKIKHYIPNQKKIILVGFLLNRQVLRQVLPHNPILTANCFTGFKWHRGTPLHCNKYELNHLQCAQENAVTYLF